MSGHMQGSNTYIIGNYKIMMGFMNMLRQMRDESWKAKKKLNNASLVCDCCASSCKQQTTLFPNRVKRLNDLRILQKLHGETKN